MTVKEFLAQGPTLNAAIDAKMEQLAELKALALTSKSFLSAAGAGERRSKVEATVEKIYGMEEEMNGMIDRYVDTKKEISQLLDKLEDNTVKSVMELHYLSGIKWEEVAERCYLSLRTVHNLHKKALALLEEKRKIA